MRKKIATVFCSIIAFCGIAGGITALTVNAKAEVNIVDNPILETYELYDTFEIPQVELSYKGETAMASGKLVMPDGTEISDNSLVLSQSGKYTIIYTAMLGGEIRSYVCSFDVEIPLSEVGNDTANAYYGTYGYAEEVTGISASIPSGSEFVYNKVINVSDLTEMDTLVRFYSDAAVQRVIDCSTLTWTLTDAYDAENYISITLTYAAEYWAYATVTMPGEAKVGANRRYDAGSDTYIMTIQKNKHGAQARFDFGSNKQYGNATMAQSYMEFNYDDAQKAIYLTTHSTVTHSAYGGNHQMIADLDDLNYFSKKWQGFTTGEVILSLKAGSYASGNPAKFFISKIVDEDLSMTSFKDEFAPTIEVEDFGYTEIPYAVVGQEYKIFKANAIDIQSGVRSLTSKVYKDYATDEQVELAIQDGVIIPEESGSYTMVYTAVDFFGNESVKLYPFEVLEEARDIYVNVAENGRIYNANVGEIVKVAEAFASGGSGNNTLECKAILLDGNVAYPIENGYFQPMQAGTYYVQYTATDYIGEKKMGGYMVNVTLSESAVFDSEPILPKYFLENFEYNLPKLVGYNYSASPKTTETASISVTDKNGTKILNGTSFTPSVANNLDLVTVKYYIGDNELIYQIPCVKAYADGKFSKADYFIADDSIQVAATAAHIAFTTAQDGASFEFANALIASGVKIAFDIDPVKNAFETVSLYLTDSANPEQKIKVSFTKNNSDRTKSYLTVNDGDAYNVAMSFYGEAISSFSFVYSDSAKTISDGISNNIVIGKYLNGETFDGFSSGKVYLEMVFEGVTGESVIKLKNINDTPMNSKTTNTSFPAFAVNGAYGGGHEVGEIVEIPEVIAMSVFNPSVKLSFSVLNPNGEYVTTTDGTLLKDITENRDYYILVNTYGSYEVRYTAVDSLGKENSFSYTITVEDEIVPVFDSVKIQTTAKVGDTITVPAMTANDADSETTVACYYITPAWDMTYIKAGASFTITQKGIYTVRYMAFDASGNIALRDYTITVE